MHRKYSTGQRKTNVRLDNEKLTINDHMNISGRPAFSVDPSLRIGLDRISVAD